MPMRVNYFDRQFLKVEEFQAEQTYHLDARRRLTQAFQAPGIVTGLEVYVFDAGQVGVKPGMAIDKWGREIVVEEVLRGRVVVEHAGKPLYVTIAYKELADPDSKRKYAGAPETETRMRETGEVTVSESEPAGDGSVILLAKVDWNPNAPVGQVLDGGVRRATGTKQVAADAKALGTLCVQGHLGVGMDKVDNPESWNRLLEVTGAGNARLTVRSHFGDGAVEGRVQAHANGWWGAAPGMIIGTKSKHDLAFGIEGAVKMTLSIKDGVVVSAPLSVTGTNATTLAANLTVGRDLKVGGEVNASGRISSPMWKATRIFGTQESAHVGGPLPVRGGFTSSGGTLLVFMNGSGYTSTPESTIGMQLFIDGRNCGMTVFYVTYVDMHRHWPFIGGTVVVPDVGAGNHTLELRALAGTGTNGADYYSVTVVELPF